MLVLMGTLIDRLAGFMGKELAWERVFGPGSPDGNGQNLSWDPDDTRIYLAESFIECLTDSKGEIDQALASDPTIQGCFWKAVECPLNAQADDFVEALVVFEAELKAYRDRGDQEVSEDGILEYFAVAPKLKA